MNFSCFDSSVSPNCGDNFRIGFDCVSLEESSKLEDFDEVKAALNSKSSLVPIKQNVFPSLSSDESLITAFPKEILSLILSYANCADPYSLSNAFKVSRLWSCVVKDSVKNAFRAEAFGNARWKECGGGEIVKNEDMNEEATSLSTFIDDIMKNIFKALYMLRAGRIVRMPKDLTLENIGALVKLKLPESGKNGYQDFYPPEKQEHAGGSYWLWSSATRIKDSGGKSYPVQRKMASDRDYQDSHAREVAARLFAEFSLSGTFLCNDWSARCLDTRGTYPFVVGFGLSGLRVCGSSNVVDFIAVLGVLRWRPAEVRSSVLG